MKEICLLRLLSRLHFAFFFCMLLLVHWDEGKAQSCTITNIIIEDTSPWPIIEDRDGLDDRARGMTLLEDGGFVVVGETSFILPSPHTDAWIVRYYANGTKAWEKYLGGNSADAAYAVRQSDDGNLIVCGKKASTTYGSPINYNAWFFKLSLSTGDLIGFEYEYGGSGNDFAWDIVEDLSTDPDQYVIVGGTGNGANGTLNGKTIDNAGEIWVFAINPSSPATPLWQNLYDGGQTDGTENDWARSIIIDHNGKYVVSGYCLSCYDDKTQMQAMLIKLRNDGAVTFWKEDYGDEDETDQNVRDQGSNAAIETYDAGTDTYGYFGTGIHHPDHDECFDGQSHDFYGYATSNLGVSLWSGGCVLTDGLNYGGKKDDNAYSVVQTCDGNYLIVGATKSKTDDVSCNNNPNSPYTFDAWVVKIDAATGEILWEETIGDVGNDEFHDIEQLEDGSFIAVGEIESLGVPDEQQNFYIVKFELTECAVPVNLTATSLPGCTSIKFDWDDLPCAKEYEIRYRTSSTGWTTQTTTLSEYTAGSLSHATYQWKVKAKCSPTVWSEFTGNQYHTLSPSCRVGIEDRDEQQTLSIYPQPSDGSFRISFTSASETNLTTTIQILDYAGIAVETIPVVIENGNLNFQYHLPQHISSGFYYLSLLINGITY